MTALIQWTQDGPWTIFSAYLWIPDVSPQVRDYQVMSPSWPLGVGVQLLALLAVRTTATLPVHFKQQQRQWTERKIPTSLPPVNYQKHSLSAMDIDYWWGNIEKCLMVLKQKAEHKAQRSWLHYLFSVNILGESRRTSNISGKQTTVPGLGKMTM